MTQSTTSPESNSSSPTPLASPWGDALRGVQLLNLIRSSNTTELNTKATLRSAWGDNLQEPAEPEEMRVNSPSYHVAAAPVAPAGSPWAAAAKWGLVAGASALGLGAPATALLCKLPEIVHAIRGSQSAAEPSEESAADPVTQVLQDFELFVGRDDASGAKKPAESGTKPSGETGE